MLDIGWYEMLVIAAIAIIVVGPRDLPKVMRGIGRGVRKMRGMAREFQSGMDELAAEAEMEELRKEMNQIKSGDWLSGDLGEAGPPGMFSGEHKREIGKPAQTAGNGDGGQPDGSDDGEQTAPEESATNGPGKNESEKEPPA